MSEWILGELTSAFGFSPTQNPLGFREIAQGFRGEQKRVLGAPTARYRNCSGGITKGDNSV